MIRQCAWCCQVVGQVAPLDDLSVTHGLCAECHANLLATQAGQGTGAETIVSAQTPPPSMPHEAIE